MAYTVVRLARALGPKSTISPVSAMHAFDHISRQIPPSSLLMPLALFFLSSLSHPNAASSTSSPFSVDIPATPSELGTSNLRYPRHRASESFPKSSFIASPVFRQLHAFPFIPSTLLSPFPSPPSLPPVPHQSRQLRLSLHARPRKRLSGHRTSS